MSLAQLRNPSLRKLASAASLAALVALTGCETEGLPTASRFPQLEAPSFPAEGDTGGKSCSVPGNSLTRGARDIVADFKVNQCARLNLCVDPSFWTYLRESNYISGIDLVILFDTTGSMSPYIEAMIRNMQQLVLNLSEMTPNLRIGLAEYRDFGDKSGEPSDFPFKAKVPLTTAYSQVTAALGGLVANGGGDTPESLSTAIRAAVDGKAFSPYFGAGDMQWSSDQSRVKIVLAVTDAEDRKTDLPTGASDLKSTAELLKSKGILLMGIGHKGFSSPSYSEAGSYDDLSFLARQSGAIARAPGIDLDGDGLATRDGEVKEGDPAVLQMDQYGNLIGARSGVDPTKVLANAISQMVRVTRPFKLALAVDSLGRPFTPETNVLAVSPDATGEKCFAPIDLGAKDPLATGCVPNSAVHVQTNEETTATLVDPRFIRATIEPSPNCGQPDANPNDHGVGTGS